MRSVIAILLSALFFLPTSLYGQLPPASKQGFAVVELFTSEGCSGCLSAEAVLKQLNDEHRKNVYLLELHVDYWNQLGWKDTYSSKEFTDRQKKYVTIFKNKSPYTPQVVVNGKREVVETAKEKLKAAIDNGLNTKATNAVQVAATNRGRSVTVEYTLESYKGQALNIAIVQKQATNDVKQGENKGKKMQHTNVVRSLKTIEPVQKTGSVTITLPAGLSAGDCGIIAFTQQKETWDITGAAGVDL